MYRLIVVFYLPLSCFASENTTTDFPEKPILRYGFQYTYDCQDFEKAFICVKKCQDLNYDSATSDKHCKCTCYMKPEIHKYKNKSNTTRDDWKLGAPSTKLPIWAQTITNEKNDKHDDTSEDEKSESTHEEAHNEHHSENATHENVTEENSKDEEHTSETASPDSTETPELSTASPSDEVTSEHHESNEVTSEQHESTESTNDVETTEPDSESSTPPPPTDNEVQDPSQ